MKTTKKQSSPHLAAGRGGVPGVGHQMSPAAFLSTSLGHAQPAAQRGDQDDDQNDHADQDHDFLLRMNKTPLQSTGFSSRKRLLKLQVNPKQKSCCIGLFGPPKHKHKLPHFKKKLTSCSSNIYRIDQTLFCYSARRLVQPLTDFSDLQNLTGKTMSHDSVSHHHEQIQFLR